MGSIACSRWCVLFVISPEMRCPPETRNTPLRGWFPVPISGFWWDWDGKPRRVHFWDFWVSGRRNSLPPLMRRYQAKHTMRGRTSGSLNGFQCHADTYPVEIVKSATGRLESCIYTHSVRSEKTSA